MLLKSAKKSLKMNICFNTIRIIDTIKFQSFLFILIAYKQLL